MMGKLNEKTIVTTINTNDMVVMVTEDGIPVRIKKNDLVEAIREAMPITSKEKNGLISSGTFLKISAQKSILLYESSGPQSTGLLLCISFSTGGRSSLYYISVTRAGNDNVNTPSVAVKLLYGDNTAKIRYKNDPTTGSFKLYIERTQYTPIATAILMNYIKDRLSMIAVEDEELENSIYAEFV